MNVEAYLLWVLSNINTLAIEDLLPYSNKAKQFKIEVDGWNLPQSTAGNNFTIKIKPRLVAWVLN